MVENIIEFTLELNQKPWTTNTERSTNRYKIGGFTSQWRGAFAWLAKSQKIPPMKWIEVTAEPHQKFGRLQDIGACNPAVKAAIDGLVDAGVLPDDSSEYMQRLTFLPPQRDKDSLVLIIRGEKA